MDQTRRMGNVMFDIEVDCDLGKGLRMKGFRG